MFPIKSSDAYIKENGKRSTIGAELGTGGGGGGGSDLPEYSISDAGKVLTVGDDGELEWHETGGAGGVYVGTTPPDATLGSNGEYYYLRVNKKPWTDSVSVGGLSNQQTYGTEYTFVDDCVITALMVYKQSSATNVSLRIGNTSDIIANLSDLTCVAGWNKFDLPEPITVHSGDVIIIQEVSGYQKCYTQTISNFSGDTSIASATGAYYGDTYPGTREAGTRIFVTFEFEIPYYLVQSQYYKTNNAWTLI